MRTSRKHTFDRRKNLTKRAVCQAVQGIEGLESRVLFALSSITDLAVPSPDPYTAGTAGGVNLTATVSAASAGPTPSGTVSFFVGTTLIGSPVPLTAGVAFLNGVTTLPVGSDSITADYSGDGTFQSSNSTPQIEIVNGSGTTTAGTTTTLNSGTSTAPVGTNITFNANVAAVTSGGPAVTGTITFFNGGTQIGSPVTVDSSGNASISTSTLPVGADSITATYGGDANYSTSNSAAFIETITSSSGSTATSTTVNTLTPTITAGSSVTFNAVVTPGTGTGTVQFMSNGTPIGAPQMLVGGGASLTTSTLPVGTDQITAVYSGDTTFAGSTSPAITETVNAGALTPTTTTVNTSAPTVAAGSPVTFTATIAPTGATGTVQFFSDGTAIGAPQPVASDMASLTISTLPVGTDSITAVYSGDSSFTTSTSAAITETVTAGISSTTTTLVALPASPTVGALVTLTATVTPNTATGTVQFFDGTTLLGTAPVSGGVATLGVASLVLGSHSLTATYGGDTDDSPSTSAVVMISEAIGTPVLTPSSSAPTIAFGDSVTFTATVAPAAVGGPLPTGMISFLDGTTALGAPITLNNGVATFLATSLAVGSHSITFTYTGDTNYTTGTSMAIIETVDTGPTTTTLTTSPDPSIFNQGVNLTATVVSVNATGITPTGTVTFFDGTTQLGAPVALVNGVATAPIFTLPTGSDSISAVYSGDPDFSTSTSLSVTQTVNVAPTTTLLTTSSPTIVYGDSVTLFANVLGASITGTVSFFSGGTLIGTATLAGNNASLTVSTLPVGADNLTAVYSGDQNFGTSTSAVSVVTVTPGVTLTSLTANPSIIAIGAPVTFTVNVASLVGSPIPTGTITLTEDGTTVIASGLILVNGTATFTTTALPLGVSTIVASYSGDATYLGSVSASTSIGVSAVTTTTSTTSLTSSTAGSNYGDPITFTAVVAPALSSNFTPTGTVTFYDGTIALGAPVALSSGIAFFTTSSLPPGINSITAVYNGDANFTTSTSAPVIETVTGGNNTGVYVTTLDVSAFNAAFGSPVTLTANVFPSSSSTPPPFGGTVTFFAGSQTLGAATLASNGVATFLTPLPAGTDEITAAYNGGGPITASLPRMVAISSPATPSLAKANLPPAIVVGTSFHTNLPITVANLSASQLKGLFTIQVYLDTSKTLDGNRTLLTTLAKNFSLNGHKSRMFRAGETLPSSLPAGTYYLLVDVTDPNGLTNLTASTPIVVAAPFVGLKASVSATNPPNIGIGRSAAVFVTITNMGNEAASGLLSLTLSPSTDGINSVVGKTLGTGSITTTIMPGKSKRFRVVLDTTALATGSYFPYITAALDGVTTTAVGITPFTVG